ncbi:MAG TPA: ribosome small subunit-dependent GTPase A [Eubacteriales bacterium]|nr:ribosome small subunit-dependent GTPase A [Clostridia bacterium]HRV73316.1 ribosome small subunit-dependent GTPase A [Eubacteriales bacterium]
MEANNQTCIGRVIAGSNGLYTIETPTGITQCRVTGRFMHLAASPSDYPVTGDLVELNSNTISGLVPRKSVMTRAMAGQRKDAQLICANVDFILICMSLNDNLNPRRLERYIAAIAAGGAEPVLVLTKADLNKNAESIRSEYQRSYGIRTLLCSAPDAYDEVRALLTQGVACALVGSSGVGKSTLLNALLGSSVQATLAISQKGDRGRHTTTARELFTLPSGAAVIDTPGMRELKLDNSDVDAAFTDIIALASQCKYSDCKHEREPGCAVKAAVAEGRLDPARLASYVKLAKEQQRKATHFHRLQH